MGGLATLSLAGPTKLVDEAVLAVKTEVVRLEGKYSRYLPTSFLSEINEAAENGGSIVVDDETAGLLDYAFACFGFSDGLFDISSGVLRKAWNFPVSALPDASVVAGLLQRLGLEKVHWSRPELSFSVPGMELDFGGIAKEYAVDRAVDICRAMEVEYGLIEMAGDIRAIGSMPDGSPWRISVENSGECVELSHAAITTSGDYARMVVIDGRKYSHLLNPKTGWPIEGLSSVTVVAPTCMVAGTYSTIGMLKGPSWLESIPYQSIWIDQDGRVFNGGPRPQC